RLGQPANCILPRLRSFVNTILYHASPACAPLRAWSTRAPSRHRPSPCSPQRNVAYHATGVSRPRLAAGTTCANRYSASSLPTDFSSPLRPWQLACVLRAAACLAPSAALEPLEACDVHLQLLVRTKKVLRQIKPGHLQIAPSYRLVQPVVAQIPLA